MFRWSDTYALRGEVAHEQRKRMEKYIDKWHQIADEGVWLMLEVELMPESPARYEFHEAYRKFEDMLDNDSLDWRDSEFELHAKTKKLQKQLELMKRLYYKVLRGE